VYPAKTGIDDPGRNDSVEIWTFCSSTSRDVCKLYNNGGIARVFGQPKLLELVFDPNAPAKAFYNQEDEHPKQAFTPLSNITCPPKRIRNGDVETNLATGLLEANPMISLGICTFLYSKDTGRRENAP